LKDSDLIQKFRDGTLKPEEYAAQFGAWGTSIFVEDKTKKEVKPDADSPKSTGI
jgi:hypothetical protein